MKKLWIVLLVLAVVVAVALLAAPAYKVGRNAMGVFQQAQDASADLEAEFGAKPAVGFNWTNGSLTLVSVEFPSIIADRPLAEIAAKSRDAVVKRFGQTPSRLTVGFNVDIQK